MTDRSWRLRRRIVSLRGQRLTVTEIAKRLACSRRHVFRVLAEARRESEGRGAA